MATVTETGLVSAEAVGTAATAETVTTKKRKKKSAAKKPSSAGKALKGKALKGKDKIAKKKGKEKAKPAGRSKLSGKPPAPSVRRTDNARSVAKASGKLNIDQIRILRALKKTSATKPAGRDDIKEAVGIGREGKYSQKWLASLKDLSMRRPKLVMIEQDEATRTRRLYHYITPAGLKALESAEKASA